MSKFSVGDRVAFARDVVRRVGHDKHTADARGRVVAIDGRVVAVDFGQTMVRADTLRGNPGRARAPKARIRDGRLR